MRKRNIFVVTLNLLLCVLLLLSGCDNDRPYWSYVVNNHNPRLDVFDVFLDKGETHEIDFGEQFKDSEINITKVTAASSNTDIFTVKGNKITATGMGKAVLSVEIYSKKNNTLYFTSSAFVYVIDRNAPEIIEINTAKDLANMNENKTGIYILKNDIDLSDWGDWEPIGNLPSNANAPEYANAFRGMFVNPDGYKIKNLTISSSANISHGIFGGCASGLFGTVFKSYIDGIILEDVFIDVTDYEGNRSAAGGIASQFAGDLDSVIRNCRVSGNIFAQAYAGGIADSTTSIKIIGCSFDGSVTAKTSAGGIAAYGYIVKDCHVKGSVKADFASGGILAQAPTGYFITNSSFSGEVLGEGYKSETIAFPMPIEI